MIQLLRLWNWAGGDLPGGALWLLPLALFWALLLYLVIRPIGVLRDQRPAAWLWGGWLLLLGLHVLLRARLTVPEEPPSLLLWPADSPSSCAGVFARAEQDLRASSGLRWESREVELRLAAHLLAPGRAAPRTAAEVRRLAEALGVRLLVLLGPPPFRELQLWQLRWKVCALQDREAPADDSREELDKALRRLLERNFQGWTSSAEAWREAWQPLYQPVEDSARVWLELPVGALPPWEDLRRTDLLRALGAPAAQVVEGLNRGLAWADSSRQGGAEPWLLAGFWFASRGQWDQVGQALANALAVEARHPLIYWQLAHLAPSRLADFGYQDRDQARIRCLTLLPAFLPALYEQVPAWLARHQGGRAREAVERALVAYPQVGELQLLAGNVAYERLDYQRAQQCFLAARQAMPEDPRPWLNLGQLHVIHQQWAEALPALEQAVALGSPPFVLHLLGMAHHKLGHRTAAIQAFQRRLELGGTPAELALTRKQLDALRRETPR